MRPREYLARIASGSGVLGALRRLRPHLPLRWLSILTYHRVGERTSGYPLDPGVIDATPESFEEQMAVLRRECSPISLPDLRSYLGGATLPQNPVLVTFDDGYRDNFEVALPVLKRWGIPAVFFVATDYISDRRLYWWDRINYDLARCERSRIRLDYPVALEFELPRDRGRAVSLLLRIVKTHYRLDLPAFLSAVSDACAVAWDDGLERRIADSHLMEWSQIRQLRDAGMEVQSHSATHRPLHNLSAADLEEELSRSRRRLREEVGADIDMVALPGGSPLSHLPAVTAAIAAAGYSVAFSNGTGSLGLWSPPDALQLPRIAVDPDWSLARFRAVLHVPTGSLPRSC